MLEDEPHPADGNPKASASKGRVFLILKYCGDGIPSQLREDLAINP
jgi:hypothetical protein